MADSEQTNVDRFFQLMDYLLGPPIVFAIVWGILKLLFGNGDPKWGDPVAWASLATLLFLWEQPLGNLKAVFPGAHSPTSRSRATLKLVSIVVYSILFAVVYGLSAREYVAPWMAATSSAIFLLLILARARKRHLADLKQHAVQTPEPE